MAEREWKHDIPTTAPFKRIADLSNSTDVIATAVVTGALYCIAERLEALVEVIEERWPTEEETAAFFEMEGRC